MFGGRDTEAPSREDMVNKIRHYLYSSYCIYSIRVFSDEKF